MIRSLTLLIVFILSVSFCLIANSAPSSLPIVRNSLQEIQMAKSILFSPNARMVTYSPGLSSRMEIEDGNRHFSMNYVRNGFHIFFGDMQPEYKTILSLFPENRQYQALIDYLSSDVVRDRIRYLIAEGRRELISVLEQPFLKSKETNQVDSQALPSDVEEWFKQSSSSLKVSSLHLSDTRYRVGGALAQVSVALENEKVMWLVAFLFAKHEISKIQLEVYPKTKTSLERGLMATPPLGHLVLSAIEQPERIDVIRKTMVMMIGSDATPAFHYESPNGSNTLKCSRILGELSPSTISHD